MSSRKRISSKDRDFFPGSCQSSAAIDPGPKSIKELAVSRQKLAELRGWLENYFRTAKGQQQSPFLILNGPSGSGKTTALKLLAKELDIEYVELPATSMFDENSAVMQLEELPELPHYHQDPTESDNQPFHGESQINRFKTFLTNLNHYKRSILAKENASNKILVIEDIPSVFFVRPELLHEELDSLVKRCRSKIVPMIFVLSTSVQGESVEYKILPKHVQSSLAFQTITFRPITTAAMTKALTNSRLGRTLSRTQIDEIVLTSNGDIRHAFNFLQFTHVAGSSSSSKRSRGQEGKSIPIKSTKQEPINCDRNESVTLPHSIAKILYAKRLEPTKQCFEYLEANPGCDLNKLRNPLKEDQPEAIAERGDISSDKIIDWVHANYSDFICDDCDFETCLDCLRVLSDADSTFNDYECRTQMEPTRTSFVIRGLLYHLNREHIHRKVHKVKKFEFCPLKPPEMFSLMNTARINRTNVEQLKTILAGNGPIYHEKDLVLDLIPNIRLLAKNSQQPELEDWLPFISNMSNFLSTFKNGENCNFNHGKIQKYQQTKQLQLLGPEKMDPELLEIDESEDDDD